MSPNGWKLIILEADITLNQPKGQMKQDKNKKKTFD